MENLITHIAKGQYTKFHGGIHPPEQKFLTTDKPIRCIPMPEILKLPLQQHVGSKAELIVEVGDNVLKGQPLTQSDSAMAVPIHAPTSGKITEISNAVIAHPSGMKEQCVFIKPDGNDTWYKRDVCNDYHALSQVELIAKIANAGISGMGGAGFPTHVKVSTSDKINCLIINAAECEPYITADDLLIREQSASIIDGINILDKIIEPEIILIGIEDNKPEAIAALQNIVQASDKINVCVIPTIYPSGSEKQLIQILTGQELPSGVLPSSLGILMHNIGTCFAVADAIINDIPLIKRVVTVSGQALKKPQNVWALLGTPIQHLLDSCGYQKNKTEHIIMGGPMMGYSLRSYQVPVVKTTNCILAPSSTEISSQSKEVECIRCGQCADVCPSQLLPQELQWSAKAKDHEQLDKLNLFDCIECGACAYVCPSQIPLVHYYRIGKAEIRQQRIADIKAENAKQRFEARKVRLEKEKKAREEKHKKAAEARKARMNSGTTEAKQEKSAVADALARVKAKKAQLASASPATPMTEPSPEKDQVSAAIARAKAKKLAAQQAKAETTETSTSAKQANSTLSDVKEVNSAAGNDKKSAVAAAVAKAKAKKLAAQQAKAETTETNTSAKQENTTLSDGKDVNSPAVNDKKAAVAAAVAKAKAKKLATLESNEQQIILSPQQQSQTEEKISGTAPDSSHETLKAENTDSKKQRIAAAVAKAKAKKQLRELN